MWVYGGVAVRMLISRCTIVGMENREMRARDEEAVDCSTGSWRKGRADLGCLTNHSAPPNREPSPKGLSTSESGDVLPHVASLSAGKQLQRALSTVLEGERVAGAAGSCRGAKRGSG
jgi:hypothetical protein